MSNKETTVEFAELIQLQVRVECLQCGKDVTHSAYYDNSIQRLICNAKMCPECLKNAREDAF